MKLQTIYKEKTMELSIGKELSKEKYEELVAGTCLESLRLDELVDIALNSEEMNPGKNKIWEYAGAYYSEEKPKCQDYEDKSFSWKHTKKYRFSHRALSEKLLHQFIHKAPLFRIGPV